MVDTLVAMGFPPCLAKQALLLCQNNVERAADMLLMNPPPLPDATSAGSGSGDLDLDDEVAQLVGMGFDTTSARGALEIHGSLEAAANALLEAQQGPPAAPATPATPPRPEPPASPRPSPLRRPAEPPASPRPAKRARRAATSSPQPSEISEAEPRDASDPSNPSDPSDPSMEALTKGLTFGARAFEGAQLNARNAERCRPQNVHMKDVPGIVLASYPEAAKMRGERGKQKVTNMLSACFAQGLWTFGPATTPVNQEVLPAFQFIISEMAKLEALNPKRVGIITTLAHACEDCQQVQAREILRIFGDLTAQNETFDEQLKYSLQRQKEAALNRFISEHHQNCDLDHTQVQPHQQRAHLFSGYVNFIGPDFGLDGLEAANSDRYLQQVKHELKKLRSLTKPWLLASLKQEMSVAEWLQTLLADINNQNPAADRLINPNCIFKWVQANLSNEAAHLVFYDEDRAEEFKGQDPEQPSVENRYQPFLSRRVLVEMLVKARFLEEKRSSSSGSASSMRMPRI